jgi:hypothetical protein
MKPLPDDARLLSLYRAGYSAHKISKLLCVSWKRVAQRFFMLGLRKRRPGGYHYSRKPTPDNPRERDCLRCRQPFISEGRHNHVCGPCKSSHAWKAGGGFEVSR